MNLREQVESQEPNFNPELNLLGGVSMVSGMARASFPERLITSQPHRGETIHVHVPTHAANSA